MGDISVRNNVMNLHQHVFDSLFVCLTDSKYIFVCPSPESQARVVQRRVSLQQNHAKSLSDVFGWNFTIAKDILDTLLPESLVASLINARILVPVNDNFFRSQIRISNFTLPHQQKGSRKDKQSYYVHSTFPTTTDSVFFGPDTYLYLDFLRSASRHVKEHLNVAVDVCCGAGAGAIHLAKLYVDSQVYGLDLNKKALQMGGINADCADTNIQFLESNLFTGLPEELLRCGVDLIASNPPYIASAPEGSENLPVYADGGAQEGLELSMRIVQESLNILSRDGLIMIYTGVAISVSQPEYDPFQDFLSNLSGADLIEYQIIHPDMWPEEIGAGAYADSGRIQVVGAVVQKRIEI